MVSSPWFRALASAGAGLACCGWSGRSHQEAEFRVAVLVLPQASQAEVLQAQAAVDVAGWLSACGAGSCWFSSFGVRVLVRGGGMGRSGPGGGLVLGGGEQADLVSVGEEHGQGVLPLSQATASWLCRGS